jgi:hypothetical protein
VALLNGHLLLWIFNPLCALCDFLRFHCGRSRPLQQLVVFPEGGCQQMPQIKTLGLKVVAGFGVLQVREVIRQLLAAFSDFSETHVVRQSAVN